MSPVAHVRRRPDIAVPAECRQAISRGALVALNHSGGKDSQCMTILLARIVPREQFLVVHAPLGEVEWPGTIEHIERTIPCLGSETVKPGCRPWRGQGTGKGR